VEQLDPADHFVRPLRQIAEQLELAVAEVNRAGPIPGLQPAEVDVHVA